jgi:homocysteine S-methyltransferase
MSHKRSEFRRALAEGVVVADGAMGTLLMSKLEQPRGASRHMCLQPCLDELNLSRPELVRKVHQEYVRAGAQILGTNTFGANRVRLGLYGLAAKVGEINRAGVRIAREAAAASVDKPGAFVAGVVGPLGGPVREQIEALVESGIDLLVLETFQHMDELHEAILAARDEAGAEMVIAAHVSVEDDGALISGATLSGATLSGASLSGATLSGATTREFTKLLDEWPADVIGLNCSSGPQSILVAVEEMRAWTSKPLSAMPNAGLPAVVEGRCVYPVSPESMAEYAGRFVRAGVSILGGCCGTTPEHIRRIREVVQAGNGPKPSRALH